MLLVLHFNITDIFTLPSEDSGLPSDPIRQVEEIAGMRVMSNSKVWTSDSKAGLLSSS